jgi:hypothetical protein
MKKLKLLLLLSCFASAAFSQLQQIKIVSFTVKNTLPAKVDEWNTVPAALILTAQKAPTVQLREPKLVVQIRSNGAVVCGNNSSNANPISSFDVKTFTTAELTGMLANCPVLKEGNYQICVQFFNLDRIAISNEVCKDFKVEGTKTEDYAPPTLITPDNGKSFTEAELSRPIAFRWTPLVPKPREPVTYRLKVWQLMQGQNSTQAMRTNPPIVTKDVDNITQTVVNAIYTGPCKPPYLCDFVWMVQALNKDGKPMGRNNGNSEPYSFSAKQNEKGELKNTFPEDNKKFTDAQAKSPITFRWTPIVPKPSSPVTYRLKVWQLMQGQSGAQVMRTNKPIVTKDVADITEATVSGIYTGPCRPPYLCDYIWSVEAITRQANGTTELIGSSSATMFMVTQYIIQLDSIKVSCTAKPGVYSFSYTITNPNAGPATLNLFTVTSSVPAGASIASFTPPIGTVINSGNQLTITGTINAATNLSNICIGAEIKDVGNNFWKASKDTCVNVTPCKCDACDEKNFTLAAPPPSQIVFANNTISFTQGITVTTTPTKTIKSITADLVYFEMAPENDMCIPCNKDGATYGHFTNGKNTIQWNGTQQNLNFNITTPQLTPCCSALFRWCIRYKIEFTDCTSCSKVICYDKKKEGCTQPVGGGIKDSK